jgi:hypothetical protein
MNDILNHTNAVLNKTETPDQAIAALGALGTRPAGLLGGLCAGCFQEFFGA